MHCDLGFCSVVPSRAAAAFSLQAQSKNPEAVGVPRLLVASSRKRWMLSHVSKHRPKASDDEVLQG